MSGVQEHSKKSDTILCSSFFLKELEGPGPLQIKYIARKTKGYKEFQQSSSFEGREVRGQRKKQKTENNKKRKNQELQDGIGPLREPSTDPSLYSMLKQE